MILVDHQIRKAIDRGELVITDFDERSLQPASYDLRIGSHVYGGQEPDKPIDLTANGRAYRLPPYGNVVLETLEDLKVPVNMTGRIGLKSGFARRGLVASTGPQIDPGFEGKLFVSLFNVTAVPHVLEYADTFLTIEFHHLDSKPTTSYEGPYQGRYSIGADVLDALVRLEGLTLSQMQTQFTELQQHVKAWSAMAARIDEFLSRLDKHTDAIEQLTRRLASDQAVPGFEAVEGRRLSAENAQAEILQLFREKGTLHYSDIAETLRLDFATVVAACDELVAKGLIEEGDLNG